jgi:hypothetical protein
MVNCHDMMQRRDLFESQRFVRTGRAALTAVLALGVALATPTGAGATAPAPTGATVQGAPDLGPNVYVFTPSTPQSEIQSTVDAVANQQLSNQFGTQRYALLFEPGTYGSADNPLNFQVGYYTEVAGLGKTPGDVVINGSVDVYNQCDEQHSCIALTNFWRSLSNLTINVTNPDAGCYTGEFWAVSQAAPMRRVQVNGNATLMDYCTGPSFASGGFIADSSFTNGSIVNGSQQQFFVRNTAIDSWSNGVWNQVFAGDDGAPAECFPARADCGGPYTTLATTPTSREKPYLYVDDAGDWQVFVPAARDDATGNSWSAGPTTGSSIPLSRFFIAHPATPIDAINHALSKGMNLLLTPGVYDVDHTIAVKRADTVVLGLGFATLTALHGVTALRTANVPGVDIAGLIVDAGPEESDTLVKIGTGGDGGDHQADATNPTALQDVFFRVGGPHAGRARVSLEVNSDDVILDDIWAWRADHGSGVGWTQNTADTGLLVNGDNVTATGLFVEHYQKFQVIWNGGGGTDIFFQSEMPYDPPSQSAWMSDQHTDGYAAVLVSPSAHHFAGYGMGTYSFFNQGIDIYAAHAYQVPTRSDVHLHDLLTIFLDATNGKGGILNVVNDEGGPSTAANADVPVTVVDYP